MIAEAGDAHLPIRGRIRLQSERIAAAQRTDAKDPGCEKIEKLRSDENDFS
jgi:hypothetical protein